MLRSASRAFLRPGNRFSLVESRATASSYAENTSYRFLTSQTPKPTGNVKQSNYKEGAEKAKEFLPGGGGAGFDSPKDNEVTSRDEMKKKAQFSKIALAEGVDAARDKIDDPAKQAADNIRGKVEGAANAVAHGVEAVVPPNTATGREEVKESAVDKVKAAATKVKQAFTGSK